ncbi:MAG: SIS domain-containing protein [Staphylococcus sp.]|nr:SIS domain-containing protein [Staphylococcus sp.]
MRQLNIKESMRQIVEAEARALQAIPYSDAYDKAVDLIIEHVHHRGGKLVASGMGKAGQIALNIATKFSSTGTPALSLHPSEAQHGDIGVLQPNDLLLLVSNSGGTREVLELTAIARTLHPGIPVIAITGNGDSELSRAADVTLLTGGAEEVCPLGLTPTTSTTVMSVIGDILVVNVTRLTGFTAEDYAKRHHGGHLGFISRQRKETDIL